MLSSQICLFQSTTFSSRSHTVYFFLSRRDAVAVFCSKVFRFFAVGIFALILLLTLYDFFLRRSAILCHSDLTCALIYYKLLVFFPIPIETDNDKCFFSRHNRCVQN